MMPIIEKRFHASVSRADKHCYIILPFDPDEAWGQKSRHYVTGTIDGHGIRQCLNPDSSPSILPLGPSWLERHEIRDPDNVEVHLMPEGPQACTVEPDFAEALQSNPRAREFFDSLATFYRKNFVRWIESAKRPETRANRIREAIEMLNRGQREK